MSWFAASLLKTSTRTSISNPGQSGFDTDPCETGALAQLALPHVQKPAKDISEAVMKPAGETPVDDDATVFVIKVIGP